MTNNSASVDFFLLFYLIGVRFYALLKNISLIRQQSTLWFVETDKQRIPATIRGLLEDISIDPHEDPPLPSPPLAL